MEKYAKNQIDEDFYLQRMGALSLTWILVETHNHIRIYRWGRVFSQGEGHVHDQEHIRLHHPNGQFHDVHGQVYLYTQLREVLTCIFQ